MRKNIIKVSGRVESTAWENWYRKSGVMLWYEGRKWHIRLELFWRILNEGLEICRNL